MSLATIFAGPYALLAKWGVIAALVAAFGGWAWFEGNEHGTEKLTKYIGEQAVEATKINTARQVVTERVITKYVKVQGETKLVTETIEKEVVKYAQANRTFTLDREWRGLHDRAAANTLSSPAARVDGAVGTAPTAAEAITTVTGNYARANRTADTLDALQSWVREQGKVK